MARQQTRKAGGSYHRFSRIIRHSLRDGFNAYSALSPGTGLSCPRRRADRSARLDLSVGRPGPHAFASASAPFVRTNENVRVAKASTASRAPRVVTIGRNAPLRARRDGSHHASDFWKSQPIFTKIANNLVPRQIDLTDSLPAESDMHEAGHCTGCARRPRRDRGADARRQNLWYLR